MDALVKKQRLITGYLEFLLNNKFPQEDKDGLLKIISPSQLQDRGSMLSLMSFVPLDTIETELQKRGIVVSNN